MGWEEETSSNAPSPNGSVVDASQATTHAVTRAVEGVSPEKMAVGLVERKPALRPEL